MSRDLGYARLAYELAARHLRVAFLDAAIAELKAGFRDDQPRDDCGRWCGGAGSVLVTRVDRTGNPRVDTKTETLVDVVKEIMTAIGPGSGPEFGVEVHTRSAQAIRELDLPGIGRHGVEQSFSAGDIVRYGLDGNIRTDIVLRDGRTEAAPILAVWDIKTGRARLTAPRAAEIRRALGVGSDVPVIEIHAERGISVKSLNY